VFLGIVGALVLRIISLRKAAEILDMDEHALLKILDSIGYPFSYLESEDIAREMEWKN
jgi:predicted HTH domain antitoxin